MIFKDLIPNEIFYFLGDSYTEYKKLDEESAFKIEGYKNHNLGKLKRDIKPDTFVAKKRI